MNPIEPTPRERAAAGNGEMQEWIEYEADVNRPPDWMGSGDPDPKYDLAPLLQEDSFCELAFIQQLEVFFDDCEEINTAGDSTNTQDSTAST